ncbi:MAG: A/G-specific adenine glycosylase [Actinomycetota bacterium]|nr:A/G-specific adenine glycosylase [Actinomycetota bacterium]
MVPLVLDAPPRGLSSPSAVDRADLVGRLASWWRGGPRAERDALPWRATRDPWAVLVSEAMLAQTQAARVAERYPEFLAAFPTPRAMAESGVAAVIRAWSGLGYNRRALALFRLAERLVASHGEAVPASLDELLALPGVGPYTARAVLAFAFEERVGVVDTNIARVLARAVAGAPLRPAPAQRLADALVTGPPREWNLALMDFGALVCRARDPRCGSCPLAEHACAWQAARRAGEAVTDPARARSGTAPPAARFVGSDRELRGRLLRAACSGAVRLEAATLSDLDAVRLAALAAALVAEGLLARTEDGALTLPR